MVRQMSNRELLKLKAETMTQSEVAEVLECISIMESFRKQETLLDRPDESPQNLFLLAMNRQLSRH